MFLYSGLCSDISEFSLCDVIDHYRENGAKSGGKIKKIHFFEKKVENLVKTKAKTTLESVLKGNMPTHSGGAF